jgi:hypothetical protein
MMLNEALGPGTELLIFLKRKCDLVPNFSKKETRSKVNPAP